MSIFDANDDRGIKVAPSQKQSNAVYVMVYHQTLSIEEALELAREIDRVAMQMQTSPCCLKCVELPVRFCGCACHDKFYGLEPRLLDTCRRCSATLEDCYCMGGPR